MCISHAIGNRTGAVSDECEKLNLEGLDTGFNIFHRDRIMSLGGLIRYSLLRSEWTQ